MNNKISKSSIPPPIHTYIYAMFMLILVCAVLKPSYAQSGVADDFFGSYESGIFGITDKHFRGILFPETYKILPSVKAAYPGLWVSEQNSAAFGILPNRLANGDWSGVFGWTDVNNSPGMLGVWLGNFNIGSSYNVYEYSDMMFSWKTSDFTVRGAFWATPLRSEAFRGISAIIDIDNVYAYNGNDNNGLVSINKFYVNVNSLIKINDDYNLKVAIHTYNRHADDYRDARVDNRRFFEDGLLIGILDKNLTTLDLVADNRFAMDYGDEKRDTLSLSLRYSRGWVGTYLKHMLFYGVKAEAGASFVSKINDETGSFQYVYYIRRATDEGWVFSANLIAPIILDVSLFRSLRCMLSIAPQISYRRIAPLKDVSRIPYPSEQRTLYLNPQHLFGVGISEMTLSFRGGVGDKYDFAVMPTLSNDVLILAMEVRYKF